MPLEEKTPVRTFFGEAFLNMDEADASGGSFEAPKKENRYCLLELTKDQLAALEAGTAFHIKEHSAKHAGVAKAALTMTDNTWEMEFLENSNPMYLGNVHAAHGIQDVNAENKSELANKDETAAKDKKLGLECTIFAQCRGNLFLKPSSGDSQRVRELLMSQPIDAADEGRTASITTSHLQYKVAASPKELQQMLQNGPYVECDGGWCFTPAAFEREVIDAALNLIAVNGWDKAAVPISDLFQKVQSHFGEDHVPSVDVLQSVLRGLVQSASSPEKATEDKKSADGEKAATENGKESDTSANSQSATKSPEAGRLSLDPEKVKVFQATQLLREPPTRIRERFDLSEIVIPPRPKRPRLGNTTAVAGGREATLQVEEFCSAFSTLTGSETTIEELHKLLGDSMYVDEMDGAVRPLDAAALPQEPKERLRRLFELSSHWKPERLSLLMAPVVNGVKVDAWLLKTTRTVYIEFEKGKEQRMMTKKFGGLS